MQMGKISKDKTYRETKRDQYTIVLEDLRSDFRVFGEALQFTNQKIDRLEQKVDVLDVNVQILKADVSEMKIMLRDHGQRLDNHDEQLKSLKKSA